MVCVCVCFCLDKYRFDGDVAWLEAGMVVGWFDAGCRMPDGSLDDIFVFLFGLDKREYSCQFCSKNHVHVLQWEAFRSEELRGYITLQTKDARARTRDLSWPRFRRFILDATLYMCTHQLF